MIRKGVLWFTLLSAVIFGALLAFYFLYWPKVQQRNAALIAHIVEEASSSYFKDYQAYPRGDGETIIETLLGKNSREKSYLRPEFRQFLGDSSSVRDSWKQPFQFDSQADGSFKLRSPGPNGTFGDSDDITSADALD